MSTNSLFLKRLFTIVYSTIFTFQDLFSFIPNSFKIFNDKIYSLRLCKKFNCKKVIFSRYQNWTLGEKYFKIGEGTRFGKQSVLSAWEKFGNEDFNPEVIIGTNCRFGDYLHLTCINKIIIGDNLLTGRWVTISDNGHGNTALDDLTLPPLERKLVSKGCVEIGQNVWIGDKATILSGVKIGDGAVIASNCVVTKDVPPYSVVAGVPGKIVKDKSNTIL